MARGGTIFLDEIGTVPPSARIKLLQVLQDRTLSRVGGEEVQNFRSSDTLVPIFE